ncbi:MAG: ABC transporter ATP-binding protein [Actinomycetota bacterium]|nr:ABC transporter ATP-binding protein [Actinomycetota bacterium]
MSRLSLEGLGAAYRGRRVLIDVSVSVPTGRWLAVIGPNGAAKSTLLKAVAGLVPHTGTARLGGVDLAGLRPRTRARTVAYAPQNPSLPTGLTVTDYALLGRTPHLRLLGRESRRDLDVVGRVLARLDLEGLADRSLGTLSGGEAQRAVLARALAQEASLLLLDEPTTGLDVGHAQALLELVDRLRTEDEVTVVSSLHDLTLAGQYAHQLLLLVDGRAVATGAPADVLTEELLAHHYGADVAVLETGAGSRAVVPRRPQPSTDPRADAVSADEVPRSEAGSSRPRRASRK